ASSSQAPPCAGLSRFCASDFQKKLTMRDMGDVSEDGGLACRHTAGADERDQPIDWPRKPGTGPFHSPSSSSSSTGSSRRGSLGFFAGAFSARLRSDFLGDSSRTFGGASSPRSSRLGLRSLGSAFSAFSGLSPFDPPPISNTGI